MPRAFLPAMVKKLLSKTAPVCYNRHTETLQFVLCGFPAVPPVAAIHGRDFSILVIVPELGTARRLLPPGLFCFFAGIRSMRQQITRLTAQQRADRVQGFP